MAFQVVLGVGCLSYIHFRAALVTTQSSRQAVWDLLIEVNRSEA